MSAFDLQKMADSGLGTKIGGAAGSFVDMIQKDKAPDPIVVYEEAAPDYTGPIIGAVAVLGLVAVVWAFWPRDEEEESD